MPILQPVQTIIRADDFQDKAFSFMVESVLDSYMSTDDLVISVSDGYWLTTSLTTEPKTEQAFKYTKQPNGQWVASGTARVMFVSDWPPDGTITIQNSLAERVIMTVDTHYALTKQPELTISHDRLTFRQMESDKASFLLFTIAQQQADTPVILTTDAPEYFQLASDSRPIFGPTLTLVPSLTGTYVHVRYFSEKHGPHTGQLTIEAPYVSKIVALEGRRAGLLPAIRNILVPGSQAKKNLPARSSSKNRWATILAVGFLGGLSYGGYRYHCQLFPTLCQERTTDRLLTQHRLSLPTPSLPSDSLGKSQLNRLVTNAHEMSDKVVPSISSLSGLADTNQIDKSLTESPLGVLDEQNKDARNRTSSKITTKQNTDNQVVPTPRRRSESKSVEEESELEKELNRPF
jgi:hypothetical protein